MNAPRTRVWWLLILGGVLSATHIWKLAGALPALLVTFQMSLVSAGVLFAIIQAASIVGGLPTAWFARVTGVKRLACAGLVLLATGSVLGATVDSYFGLVLFRGVEGVGFLAFTVLAPSLIAAHAAESHRNFAVGAWAMFQGVAAFVGLALTPIVLTVLTWQGWWISLGLVTLVLALALIVIVPADDAGGARVLPTTTTSTRWGMTSLLSSLKSRDIWIAGVAFACYSGPWLAVLGFLPTVFDGVGLGGPAAGLLAGGVGFSNALGAFAGARFLNARVKATRLLFGCFCGTAVSIACAFLIQPDASFQFFWVTCWLSLFSALGGVIAAVLTRLGVSVTPSTSSPPLTFGLMQQIFNIGNLAGPPLLAWIVGAVGGWQGTLVLVLAAALAGTVCVLLLARPLRGLSDV